MYLEQKWNYYKPRILAEGFPQALLAIYEGMMNMANSKVLLDSIYSLFHLNWSIYLDSLSKKNLLIINSRQETKMFRHQAELLRRRFSDGKSAFYPGDHGDFILNPKSDVVKEVVRFLTI